MSIAGKEQGESEFRVHPQTKVILKDLTGNPASVAKTLVTLVFNTMIRTKEVRASCVPPVNVLCPLWCVPPVNHRCAYVALVCVLCVCPCLPLLVSPLCYPCTRTPLPGTSFAPCVPPCSPSRQFFFLHCPPAGPAKPRLYRIDLTILMTYEECRGAPYSSLLGEVSLHPTSQHTIHN